MQTQIKTIADFKRAMQLGTKWHTTHKYTNGPYTSPTKDMGVRECGLHYTIDFGFKTDHDTISHCTWPKKAQFRMDGDTVVITTSFCQLKYTQVHS